MQTGLLVCKGTMASFCVGDAPLAPFPCCCSHHCVDRLRDSKLDCNSVLQEKNSVEAKLKDFETSLQKLKDCTYTEASQRREFELNLKNAQAELQSSNLREQVSHSFSPILAL